MVENLLKQLRTKVEDESALPEATKSELLTHLETVETHTAGGDESVPAEARHGLGALVDAVEGLEASHPDITSLVNRIAIALGNMGI